MKRTKMICTIGPNSESVETLKQMALSGMNVARLNMSHGGHEEQQVRIDRIRQVSEELGLPIAILIDTKGPEVRIKTFKDGKITLKKGDIFSFVTYDVEGDETKVSVTYKNLPNDIDESSKILVNDGLLEFDVFEITNDTIKCNCLNGGVLRDKKGMNFPNTTINIPYLSDIDKSDIQFAIDNKVEYIAASFVSNKQNVLEIKNILKEQNASGIDVIAKIENHDGVNNLEEIIDVADGVMVARGDMGVELPFYKLPTLQKQIIKSCRNKGKRVIIATEMLESMIDNLRPTRAETSDVANAVYDGASAVMLSAETTIGKHVVNTVKTMANIIEETEKSINFEKRFLALRLSTDSITDAISHSACSIAYDLNSKLIVVFTTSGITARMISRFRPNAQIIAATTDIQVYNKLALNWGVHPILVDRYGSVDELFNLATKIATDSFETVSGDKVVIVAGTPVQCVGQTNTVKLIEVVK